MRPSKEHVLHFSEPITVRYESDFLGLLETQEVFVDGIPIGRCVFKRGEIVTKHEAEDLADYYDLHKLPCEVVLHEDGTWAVVPVMDWLECFQPSAPTWPNVRVN